MKKMFLLILLPILLWGCGSDDEPQSSNENAEAVKISEMLTGTFSGSKKSLSDNLTETQVISFTKYAKPVVESWSSQNFGGDWVSKDVTMYGECEHTTYYNDHLLEVTKEYKYSIEVPYAGAQPKLVFYPKGGYGNPTSNPITIVSGSSFKMNDITFVKQ